MLPCFVMIVNCIITCNEFCINGVFDYCSQIIINKDPTKRPTNHPNTTTWYHYNMQISADKKSDIWDVKKLLEVGKQQRVAKSYKEYSCFHYFVGMGEVVEYLFSKKY